MHSALAVITILFTLIQIEFSFLKLMKINEDMGSIDGLEINVCCSCRGPEFSSQVIHQAAHKHK